MALPQRYRDSSASSGANAVPTSACLDIPPTTGKVVVLNGFPGTGKFTILKQAKELLPDDSTCLLDNHLLIDPVAAVIPERSDEHHELRRIVRAPIFKMLRKRVCEGWIILMTACLAEDNEKDRGFLEEHLEIVRRTDIPIFWINASCDQAAFEHRLRSPERLQGDKTKLTNVLVLQDLLHEHQLIMPPADGSTRLVVKTLDVSGPVELSVSRLMCMIGFAPGVKSTQGNSASTN